MHVNLKILDKGDPEPPHAEWVGKAVHEAEVTHAVIFERGTQGGQAAVLLIGPDTAVGRDGVCMHLTETVFEMLFGALQGAKQRWAERDANEARRN